MARPRRFFLMPDIDSPDWKNPGKEHTIEEFYVPAKDEDGNSHRIYCNIPENLYGWLGSIHASKKFPFQREGDIIRYGIFLVCCQLSNIEQSVPDLREIIARTNRALLPSELASSVEANLDKVAEILEKYRKDKAWEMILDTIETAKRDAETAMRSSDKNMRYWAKRWREGLESRFGDLETMARIHVPVPDFIDLRPSQAHQGDEAEEV